MGYSLETEVCWQTLEDNIIYHLIGPCEPCGGGRVALRCSIVAVLPKAEPMEL